TAGWRWMAAAGDVGGGDGEVEMRRMTMLVGDGGEGVGCCGVVVMMRVTGGGGWLEAAPDIRDKREVCV
nr:hypothetical protein [Tanacetum cinerariifolium]